MLGMLLVGVWLGAIGPARAEDAPRAVDGWIDLRDWRPAADGPVRLDGTWDFYWQELWPPSENPGDEPAIGPVPITVPRLWHRTPVRDGFAGRGFATYRLRVRLPERRRQLALRVGDIHSAVSVYAGGELVMQAGRVGEDIQTAIPGLRPGVFSLPDIEESGLDGSAAGAPVLDLVFHVSTYESDRGGLDEPVWLGPLDQLTADRTRSLVVQSLLVGGLLIMGIYHLLLFGLRRRSRLSLYFGLVCLFGVGRLLLSHELLILELWPGLSWAWTARGMYVFAFAIFGGFALYLETLWPGAVPKIVYRFVQVVAAAGCLFALIIPAWIFGRALLFLEIFVLVSMSISAIVLGRAWRHRETGRWIYAAGFAVVAVGALHDAAASQGLLGYVFHLYLEPVGVFLFLLAQSMILAQRFSASLTTVERQRGELQELVDRLERESLERKRYEELSLAASGLAHETKNPLDIIRGLAQRLVAAEASPAARRSAGQILDQADLAASRLGDFLTYARLRDPKPEAVAVGSLLRYAAEVLAPDLEAKGIPCRVDGDAVVQADEEMLLQIVLNLMLNSIAAGAEGDALELGFERDRDAPTGRLVVQDHGVGIPPELLDKVRKPYISGRADGHGLGLALVERLAELHGWQLHIESRPGEGTRVEIRGMQIESAIPDRSV